MLKNFKVAVGLLLLVVACESGSEKQVTDSGVEVTFIEKGDAEKGPEDGQILTLNMGYKDQNGKELFSTVPQGSPVAMQYIDSIWSQSGMIYEALRLMKKGDSVAFELPAEDFFENTFNMDLPDSIERGSKLAFNIGLVDNMSREDYMAYQRAEYDKQQAIITEELEKKLVSDGAAIDEYLEQNNIDAQTTESGLRYVITEEGSGPKPEAGQTVSVHYTGTLLDGTKFDSSLDRGEPLSFPIGQGNVIKGWDEGIGLLNEGSKATLFIPSPLAYGERGAGNVIPPYAILKFDVELVEVQ